jgi:hypothetical protein
LSPGCDATGGASASAVQGLSSVASHTGRPSQRHSATSIISSVPNAGVIRSIGVAVHLAGSVGSSGLFLLLLFSIVGDLILGSDSSAGGIAGHSPYGLAVSPVMRRVVEG